MNSYPRQAKEIEDLTVQLNTAREINRGLHEVYCAQLMPLRERVALLEQRPTVEEYEAMVEARDKWEDIACKYSTEASTLAEQVKFLKAQLMARRASVQFGLDGQMQQAQAVLDRTPCDCPMCEARGM